jgi:hypothetical protein
MNIFVVAVLLAVCIIGDAYRLLPQQVSRRFQQRIFQNMPSQTGSEPLDSRNKSYRDLSKGVGAAAVVAIGTLASNSAFAAVEKFIGHTTLQPLPYKYDALAPYISEKTLFYHHDKHHAKYISTMTTMIEGTDLEKKDLLTIMKKSHGSSPGLFNNAAQSWNHEFYWNCMKPNGGGSPKGKLLDAINKSFGSYEEFRKQVR